MQVAFAIIYRSGSQVGKERDMHFVQHKSFLCIMLAKQTDLLFLVNTFQPQISVKCTKALTLIREQV